MTLPVANLLPPKGRHARRLKVRAQRWALGLGGAVAVVTLAQLAPGPALAEAEVTLEVRRVGAVSSTERLRAEVSDLRRRLADINRRTTDAGLLSDRPDWSIVMALLADRAGDRLALDSCGIIPIEHGAYRISASGRAPSQAEVSSFILSLEEPGIFDAVELVESRREAGEAGEVVRFQVECRLADRVGGKP